MNSMSPWPELGATLLAFGTAFVLLRKSRPPAPPAARFVSLDGLRGYLAFAVFLHHTAVWYHYLRTDRWAPPPSKLYVHLGQSSVLMFFMITGFLFWSKLLDGHTRPICWSKLYISRVLRLVPLYAFAVAGLLLVALYSTSFHGNESFRRLAGHVGQWLAFALPGTPAINGFAETSLLFGVAWTLRYELLFYAFLPLGALLLRRTPATAWLIFSLAATVTTLRSIPSIDGILLLGFAGGMLAATAVRVEFIRRCLVGKMGSGLVVASLLVIVTCFVTAYCLPVLILLTVAFTIIACGNSMFGILHGQASRLLGEMSYSVYLLHNFLLFITFRLLLGSSASSLSPAAYWLVIGGLVPILIALCHATFRLIELPAMAAVPRVHAWVVSCLTLRWFAAPMEARRSEL